MIESCYDAELLEATMADGSMTSHAETSVELYSSIRCKEVEAITSREDV